MIYQYGDGQMTDRQPTHNREKSDDKTNYRNLLITNQYETAFFYN